MRNIAPIAGAAWGPQVADVRAAPLFYTIAVHTSAGDDHNVSMKQDSPREMTILFADVAGSVQMHSILGDVEAHRRIVDTLNAMGHLVDRCHGRVIQTIGDEIMCAFDNTDDAFEAACLIQASLNREQQAALYVRAGMHSGTTGEEDGQPFGDTVNIAARVVALAKAGQVMLTGDSFQRLNQANRSRSGFFSDVYIKGKREPLAIHQALWNPGDGTVMLNCNSDAPVVLPDRVQVRHRDTDAMLTEGTELLLGRGPQCDLQVDSDAASRVHATMRCQGGKLVLADRSTNGTFVRTLAEQSSADSPELYFHHKEWITSGSGVISLGKAVSDNAANLVYFKCS